MFKPIFEYSNTSNVAEDDYTQSTFFCLNFFADDSDQAISWAYPFLTPRLEFNWEKACYILTFNINF